jgi:DNA mismatch endonuclease (patch repair protein)
MTPDQRSALMARIRGKNTGPELAVRRLAHAWGFRFRLHRRDLPGKPDLVFPRLRKAVLVHGCFWHRHDDPACRNAVAPKTRAQWWETKLSANVARDARHLKSLEDLGWEVLTLWECEIRSGAFETRLAAFLGARPDQLRRSRRPDAAARRLARRSVSAR